MIVCFDTQIDTQCMTQSGTQDMTQCEHINKKENISKKESRAEQKRPSFNELIENYTQNEELREALKKHLITRKQGQSLNNDAILLGFKNLNILTNNIKTKEEKDKMKIAIVEKSIENGWSGFFEIKTNEIKRNNYEKQVVSSEEWEQLYDN